MKAILDFLFNFLSRLWSEVRARLEMLLALVLLLGSVSLFYLAYQAYREKKNKAQKYERTFARVIEVKWHESGNYYPVLGFYTLDSQKVLVSAKHEVGTLQDFEVGNVFEVYYDIINPDDLHIIKDEWFGFIFYSISATCLLLVGSWLALLAWRKYRRWHRLLKYGQILQADIKSVARDLQIWLNGAPAYVLYCEWNSPSEDLAYAFRSEPLPFDPTPFLPAQNKVTVLIDPKEPESYYVEVADLKKMYAVSQSQV
jgi:hypothetical protein